MGMHFGLVAVRAELTRFREAFVDVWPSLDIVATGDNFSSADEFWSWMEEKAEFVSAAAWTKENPGTQTYALFQDGDWTVLMDPTYTLATDETALEEVSRRFGSVLSFVVETAGGCATFWRYEDGDLVRSLITTDGPTESAGEPMPEEEGIDVSSFYMKETEALISTFGLTPLDRIPRLETAVAFSVADRADYGEILDEKSAGSVTPDAASTEEASGRELNDTGPQGKPWWKFW